MAVLPVEYSYTTPFYIVSVQSSISIVPIIFRFRLGVCRSGPSYIICCLFTQGKLFNNLLLCHIRLVFLPVEAKQEHVVFCGAYLYSQTSLINIACLAVLHPFRSLACIVFDLTVRHGCKKFPNKQNMYIYIYIYI